MQPSSCLWNRERARDGYYFRDAAEIGGNWVQTLAMNKSKWCIAMGACFPAPVLFSIYFEGDHSTVFCVSVCFMIYVLGVWELWDCVCKWHFSISWDGCLCVWLCLCGFPRISENVNTCAEDLLKTQENPSSFVFSTPSFLCQICFLCSFLHQNSVLYFELDDAVLAYL